VALTDRLWLPMMLSNATGSEESVAGGSAFGAATSPAQGLVRLALPESPESGAIGEGAIRALALDEGRQRIIVAADSRLLVLNASSGAILATVPLAGPAGALAVDEGTGEIYAALPERGEVVAISTGGELRARAKELGRPTRLEMGGSRVYVSDSLQQRVVVLSKSCDIIGQRTLPAAPYALALDMSGGRLYVGQMGSGKILALNTETLATESTLALGGLGYPLDLALDSSGEILYVAHALSPKYGALSVIKAEDMSLLGTLWGNSKLALTNADSVRWDPRHNVVLLGVAEGIMALDGRSLQLIYAQPLRRVGWPGTMVVDPLGGTVFVTGDGDSVWGWQGDRALAR